MDYIYINKFTKTNKLSEQQKNKLEEEVKMMNLFKKLVKGEEGQGMVEYGLIIAVVALIAVAGLTLLGGDLSDFFKILGEKLPTTV
jgi:pilus assembly protein Flp/PilA